MSSPVSPLPVRRAAPSGLRSSVRKRIDVVSLAWGAVLVSLILFVQGCGGGSGGSGADSQVGASGSSEDSGTLLIGITDAEGAFLDYSVDVTSLLLERANGATVETLPLRTRIDFTELTEVTEFLTVATVPVGVYEAMTINLDFTQANVVVQDDQGNELQADVRDPDGNELGDYAVRLTLTTADRIRIRPGAPAAFSLDFDLDASNDIDFSVTPPTVTVQPMLLATPELEADREHRVRGALAEVDEAAQEVTVKVRPFRHRDGNFGRFTFGVDGETLYEIDGVALTGNDGLVALADLAENTPVVAGGMIVDGGLAASTVLAGTSVPWQGQNVVKGVVTARELDTLTVRGARIGRANGTDRFHRTVTVLLGEDTVVTTLGADAIELTSNSISVGQSIVAMGELTDDQTLDVTEGRVRMLVNQLTGRVVDAEMLAVDVYYLNGRRPAAFDFSGTGFDEENDASAEHYQIDTGALGLSTVTEGNLVRVRGLVNEFGMAPPDFIARTVIDVDVDMRSAALGVHWPEPTSNPFMSVSDAHLDLDLNGARAGLKVRGVPVALTNPVEMLKLVAPDNGLGVYAVTVRGVREIHGYRSFADLVTELVDQLEAGNRLHRIGAHGRYNTETEELTTGRASFEFLPPLDMDSDVAPDTQADTEIVAESTGNATTGG